ncbi:MAG TPA: nucleoside monophosphate kinase [Thermoplasmata archaeon]|nr:nucleoside monophosphate kinase [Thermoplasmata archaeon]
MIVVIGGTPGSGKTTVAERFAERYGYVLVSAGAMFRQMAAAHGKDIVAYSGEAERDHSIDRELDRRVLEDVLRHDTFGSDVIVDGRIQGHLLALRGVPCLKVWIDAPADLRADRVAGRDGKTVDEARTEISFRERSERTRYLAIYGIEVRDTNAYDLVVDSAGKAPEDIVELVWSRVAA